jgi:hypothetical protein
VTAVIVVAAVIVGTAADLRADIVTGDRPDMRRLLAAANPPGKIIDVSFGVIGRPSGWAIRAVVPVQCA